jgi:type IV pilus assembly protein PilM
MGLPFLNRSKKQRTQAVVIDLGSKSTKVVSLQRKGGGIEFNDFAVLDSPDDGANDPEQLGKHLKAAYDAVNGCTKTIIVALGVNDSLVRRTLLPLAPISDMRTMLKVGSKNFLQQDLPKHVFDCHIIPPKALPDDDKPARNKQLKVNVLAGGAKQEELDRVKEAGKSVGLAIEQICPNLIGVPNAFEFAQKEAFKGANVALVDVGFRTSTINVLQNGELMLSRVLAFGGDHITRTMAEALGIGYEESEGIKVGLSNEVQETIQQALIPLARELRASIDFFEHQNDQTVSEVFLSGGTASSDFMVECLQTELMSPCKSWNPASDFTVALPAASLRDFEESAAQLAVALGIGAAALN